MFSLEEISLFLILLGTLWIYPLIALIKTQWRVLAIHFAIQIAYSLFFSLAISKPRKSRFWFTVGILLANEYCSPLGWVEYLDHWKT